MLTTISQLLSTLKTNPENQTIILVTGVFDLLHSAHVQFLRLAKAQGDILLVGLETDQRVKKIKGENRPKKNLKTRLVAISILPFVDYVFSLPVEFNTIKQREEFISKIKPDILAVSEHSPNLKQKKEIIEKFDGKLKIIMPKDPSISTSKIIKNK